ncbi:AAA family ATPase [Tetragenococcus koreensis]|uniref:RNA polymerase recycling motor HelD n=1 Tax=Tetragenococcus koreensis TaxID=290335 RepID=UPI001F1ABE1A|nr:RNA polymerase recycling motor HelD [Tetragenococcus koreensis]MCF1584594.1 AAA family ATPase [Tetragenococcus koreensis]MCF1614146.1 AAA family ATPase [Tetragenococcus koreensis]MCF1619682.1 AAA family ATPase [Tetragenococcus koreensis]MCF1623973.1 AAA family ATPase [Tetragenococcus koreensis]MCF1628966.1 AAA family ATPase [Tetragenococcus koreensis]
MNERQYEEKHLAQTISLIENEDEMLKNQQKELQKTMQNQLKEVTGNTINTATEESFYESVVEYRQHEHELTLRYQTAEAKEKRMNTLQTMAQTPYFARIDFKEEQETAETLYLGIASLRDKKDDTIIIDWRAPIANLYYEGELGEAYYSANKETFTVDLLLKRQFKIQKGQLLSMVDTSEMINDDFLLDILDETSSPQMKNIVSTIQKAQNRIIRDTTSKYMVIEGIAGSGKTSALLQRIAFLLYHHRNWLDVDQVLLFSPNHLFSDYISMVLPSLGESEVPTQTFTTFLQKLVPNYTIRNAAQEEEQFLSGQDNPIQKLKNGLTVLNQIQPYVASITHFGPIFRDLKINGQTYIKKEQIRKWYKQTNSTLPLYQRIQLLQTKLAKKVSGLQKDEAKKSWVRERAAEKIDDIYENNPDLDDSEEKEKQITKQVKQDLVKKKFHPLTRQVSNYRFINFAKQYVHFLKQLSENTLEEYGISAEKWEKSIQTIRQQMKNKEILQEDALLYFSLLKNIYPVNAEQKARFIFIDEMQDFPPAQAALLKQLFPRASMTLCGDLNQKVFGNETIVNSIDELFNGEEVTRYQLTTSYRSTEEITAFANQFLSQEDQVQTTARNGKKPLKVNSAFQRQAVDWLENDLLDETKQKAQWRTAIIGKTTQECNELYTLLSESTKENSQLITSENEFMKRSIVIIPAYLAKGLEFDRVYAWHVGENFSADDQLIFYTIATRAMHELNVIAFGQNSPLLENIDPKTYQQKDLMAEI